MAKPLDDIMLAMDALDASPLHNPAAEAEDEVCRETMHGEEATVWQQRTEEMEDLNTILTPWERIASMSCDGSPGTLARQAEDAFCGETFLGEGMLDGGQPSQVSTRAGSNPKTKIGVSNPDKEQADAGEVQPASSSSARYESSSDEGGLGAGPAVVTLGCCESSSDEGPGSPHAQQIAAELKRAASMKMSVAELRSLGEVGLKRTNISVQLLPPEASSRGGSKASAVPSVSPIGTRQVSEEEESVSRGSSKYTVSRGGSKQSVSRAGSKSSAEPQRTSELWTRRKSKETVSSLREETEVESAATNALQEPHTVSRGGSKESVSRRGSKESADPSASRLWMRRKSKETVGGTEVERAATKESSA